MISNFNRPCNLFPSTKHHLHSHTSLSHICVMSESTRKSNLFHFSVIFQKQDYNPLAPAHPRRNNIDHLPTTDVAGKGICAIWT